MNHYETIFIVDPDTPQAEQDAIFEKVTSMISADGKLVMFDDWGTRKMAYEIKKKKQGRYVRLDFGGEGPLVDAIERTFRLDYRILKYMTVLLAQDVDPDSLTPVETKVAAEAEAESAAETTDASSSDENTSDEAVETETTETESETEEK